jgi:hypothetical protein
MTAIDPLRTKADSNPMSFLDRIRACNAYDLSHFLPFNADNQTIGWIKPYFAEHLATAEETFTVT